MISSIGANREANYGAQKTTSVILACESKRERREDKTSFAFLEGISVRSVWRRNYRRHGVKTTESGTGCGTTDVAAIGAQRKTDSLTCFESISVSTGREKVIMCGFVHLT